MAPIKGDISCYCWYHKIWQEILKSVGYLSLILGAVLVLKSQVFTTYMCLVNIYTKYIYI